MKKLSQKNKINIDFQKVFSILTTVLLVAAHVLVVIISTYVFRYYEVYPQVFIDIFIIVICLFVIMDIIFFIGIKHNDLLHKIIICVLSICLVVGESYGISVINKTNEIVDNVVQTDDNEKKYETVSGMIVSYDDKYKSIEKISDLKAVSDFVIGTLAETSDNSLANIALEKLKADGVNDFRTKAYANNTDLLFALIHDEIDFAVFSSMYQAIFKADENVDYTQYLANVHEIEEFSKDIEIASNASKKNLSKDPFNVLLIGWSPVIGSTTIGLADAIIVASVNPQTYTVSMMSIARDSYVPISCYGGQCDKINSGRGTSMDCFVKTVEDLINEDIDFYMEINFSGFADLCGHYGGIEIDNPVSFELDGVYVPAGHYIADGWQALQFARERHHMPNGDFDRQQHQKEVIMKLANQILTHPLSDALEIFNFVSNRLNTNLTLSQLTSMFNMITSTKNYTGLSLFNLLDMHALRVTGYADWHYSDEYELPLWIYRLYDGSVSESLNHMQEVLGNYKEIKQDNGFSFSAKEPYVRDAFYSLSYDEVEVHETLPPFYKNLTSMTYQEALEWANANGATLVPTFIKSKDDGYDEALDGMVISQSVPYGKKISKYPTCNITVMGNGKKKVTIPDYDGWDLDRAKMWCKDNDLEYSTSVKFISGSKSDKDKVYDMHYDEDDEEVRIKYYDVCGENATPNSEGTGCSCASGYANDEKGACVLKKTYKYVKDGTTKETVESITKPSWNYEDENTACEWSNDGTTYTCTSHHWDSGTVTKEPTCKEEGVKEYRCTDSGCTKTKKVSLPKVDHTFVEDSKVDATCGKDGKIIKKCSVCGATKEEVIPATGKHNWQEISRTNATCITEGKVTKKCSVCGKEEEEIIDALGHDYHKVDGSGTTKEATCEEGGYTVYKYKCSRCDSTIDGEHEDVTGPNETKCQVTTE